MMRDILSLPPCPADRRMHYGRDANQFLDLWIPDPAARGVAMVIHGGFWREAYDLRHVSHICAALAKSGTAAASIEYRRVGNPGGGWPGTYADVRAAFDAVKAHFGPQRKFVAIGHSAGGHLALRLAVDVPELSGVIALAPVSILRKGFELNLSNGAVAEFLGGTPDSIPQIYDNACPSLHPSSVQRILLHGTNDEDVPISMSKEFEIARQGDAGTVWFMKLDEVNHFDLIDPESRAWPIVHMDVDSLLED